MFFTYIVASQPNGTIYIGHTDSLINRVCQHKDKTFTGFSARYNCAQLVWFERHETRESAFKRERQMKWSRAWKMRRIEAANPCWNDLLDGITEEDIYHPDRLYNPRQL